MAQSKGVEELADVRGQRMMRDCARAAAEQRHAAECTFQPDTCKPAVPDAIYTPAKAAFSVHGSTPQDITQRCATLYVKACALRSVIWMCVTACYVSNVHHT